MAPPTHVYGAIAFVRASVVAAGDLAQRFPQGSQLMRMAPGTQQAVVVLTPEFFAVADPQVSFDGSKLLFAGQKQRDSIWQIWEMPAAVGGAARQVTHCAGDCVRAVYLSAKEIAYTSLRGVGAARASDVYVSAESGADAHAITFGPGMFEVETALRSGRLLLSATGVGGHAHVLYVVDPDGSGLALLRQDDGAREIRGAAEELADGTIVFVQRETARAAGGALEWIHPGALHAVTVRGAEPGYASVTALGDGALVVSRRGAGSRFDLYHVELKDKGTGELLYRDPQGSSVQAVLIAAHAPVEAYRSILHPERKTGRLLCLDAYASEDVASGRIAGHVARVRVLTKEQPGELVLGDAPVEVDGSFYATVPADKPIRLELIGTKGEVVKAQRSWMWVRGGEDRGCTGCHESQALAPENRSPMALERFDTPSSLVGDALKAVRP